MEHCIALLEIILPHIRHSQYFCRYCIITQSEFQGDDPNLCGPELTIESYKCAVDHLQTEDTPDVERAKFESVFNSLKYFIVCQPDLPPCLGHDICKGVLFYDVAL